MADDGTPESSSGENRPSEVETLERRIESNFDPSDEPRRQITQNTYIPLRFNRNEDWLEWRRNHIGASDTPAILGVSRFQTRLNLLRVKLGMEKKKDTPWMKRGRDLEETVRKMVSLRLMEELESVVLQSTRYPFLVAQIDGLGPSLHVEIKVAASENSYFKTVGEIPLDYQYQMQHQMIVTGRTSVEFACFHEKVGLSVQTYKQDLVMQSDVIAAAQQFVADLESIHQENEKRKRHRLN